VRRLRGCRAERLAQIIKEIQRHRFGRRAETLPEDQLLLGFEEVEQTRLTMRPIRRPNHRLSVRRAAKRRANRGSLPIHLPRIEMVVNIEDHSCPCCRGALHVIGEDRAERLDIVPAQFRVLVIRRSAAAAPTSAAPFARRRAGRSSTTSSPSCEPSSPSSARKPSSQRRSAMRSHAGTGSAASSTTVALKSTPTSLSGRSGPSRSIARTHCSRAPIWRCRALGRDRFVDRDVHVWMAPSVQEFCLSYLRQVGGLHVSGLHRGGIGRRPR
jgi:hypothetical protein